VPSPLVPCPHSTRFASFSIYSIFFFSSRRRHTSSTRHWSSDVCSSDLGLADLWRPAGRRARHRSARPPAGFSVHRMARLRWPPEIGRASCRERVVIGVGGVWGGENEK